MTHRILIVDEDAAIRSLLTRGLERFGYEVVAVASAESAYAVVEQDPFDAVLLDLRAPVLARAAIYHALTSKSPSLAGRVIVMTSDADAQDVTAWLEEHACPVITKPFVIGELHALLQHLMKARRRDTGNG